MNKINFTAKDNFPFSSDAASMMQDQSFLASKTALLGGRNYILNGCDEDENSTVSDGVIVINGELLPFVGGQKKDKITIKEVKQTLVAFDEQYPEAYIFRSVEFADNGEYNWDSFPKVLTNKELQEKFESIKGSPLGMIEMWCGYIGQIPNNYKLCNGDELSEDEYPELYGIIGGVHGAAPQGYFKLPDLRDRFIVGYNNGNPDYETIGLKGGDDKVKIELENVPKHSHAYTDDTNAAGKFPTIEPGFPTSILGIEANESSGEKRGWGTVYNTGSKGGDKDGNTIPIDIRPKYFTVAYVMKVKY